MPSQSSASLHLDIMITLQSTEHFPTELPAPFLHTTVDRDMEDLTRKHRTLFLAGAAFNGWVAVAMMFPKDFFPVIRLEPIPEPSMYLHMTSCAVSCFGWGYYLASQDFPRHSNLIELGVAGKVGVSRPSVGKCFWYRVGI